MTVVLKGFPENKLTEEQSKKIQQAVLGIVWKCNPGQAPKFKNSHAEEGALYIICAEKARSCRRGSLMCSLGREQSLGLVPLGT
jgi:hypothetical protein